MKFYTICPKCKRVVREMTNEEYVQHWDGFCSKRARGQEQKG